MRKIGGSAKSVEAMPMLQCFMATKDSQMPTKGPKKAPPKIGSNAVLKNTFVFVEKIFLVKMLNNSKIKAETEIRIKVAVSGEKSPAIPFLAAINPIA